MATLKLEITDEDGEVMFSYTSPQDADAENVMCAQNHKKAVKELLEESIEVLGDSQFKDE
jgi:hypothetical protein